MLLFLLFVILPGNRKLERKSFIDPTDKSPLKGNLQRNTNSLHSLEEGIPPLNLLIDATETPMSGNHNDTALLLTDNDEDSNVPNPVGEDAIKVHS